ncbi:MAG: efflux RND transporter periplasmic adaptor subunit [Gammaproteobacteria bacterium]
MIYRLDTAKFRLALTPVLGSLVLFTSPQILMAQGGPPPPSVRVVEANLTLLAPSLELPGTVVSRNDAKLSAEVPGQLQFVAEVGTVVEQGDVVARIDDTYLTLQRREYRGIVARESSRREFLEKEAGRLRTLAAENVAARNLLDQTESELQAAISELEVAGARLNQIEVQLSKTRIRAPFPGVVTERLQNPGEHTSAGVEVIRLVQPDDLEVVARAPLASLNFVAEGSELVVRTDYARGVGQVRTLVPFSDGRSHLFEIRVTVPASPWRVGESVRLAVPSAEPIEVLAVPRDALVLRREGSSIYRVLEDGTAERVTVTTGLGAGGMIQITGGIDAGDRVIIRGAERLRPGQKVSVLGDDPPGDPARTADSG